MVTLEDAVEIRKLLHKQGKKLVFTNGCFDIIHRGHVEYLKKAAELGDYLIIGLNSDSSISRLKGQNRPIIPLEDRAYILETLKFVGAVVQFDTDTPLTLIKEIKPDILVKGSDYNIKDIVGSDTVLNNGGQVLTIELIEGRSTSNLIQKIIKAFNNE